MGGRRLSARLSWSLVKMKRLDDTLWLRRAHSIGNRRQLLNMITYALGVNALSMHVRRQCLAPPRAA